MADDTRKMQVTTTDLKAFKTILPYLRRHMYYINALFLVKGLHFILQLSWKGFGFSVILMNPSISTVFPRTPRKRNVGHLMSNTSSKSNQENAVCG